MSIKYYLALVVIYLLPLNASASPVDLEITRTVKAGEDTLPLEAITIKDQASEMDERFTTNERLVVRLQGKFKPGQDGFTLSCQSQATCPHSHIEVRVTDGAFQMYIVLRNTLNEVYLTSVDRTGKTEYARYVVKILGGWTPSSHPVAVQSRARPPSGSLFFGLSSAITSYHEANTIPPTGTNPLVNENQIGLTGTLGYGFRIGDTLTSRWSGQFLSYITFLPVAASFQPPIRFLGVNVRLGYDFMPPGSKWIFSLFTGFYYLSTFVDQTAYGYSNLTGPQLYPALTYMIDKGRSARMYFKYSPVNGDGGYFNINNREVAVGLSYRFLIGNTFPISVNFDMSTLQVSSTAFQNTTTASQSIYNLGVGFPLDGFFEEKKKE